MKRFYLYEGMVRLVESTVKQGTREVAVKPVFPPLEPLKAGALLLPADHSEAFTYDLNANVLTIERKGRDDAGRYRVVDDVEMEYVGNRLSVLRDAAADALLEGSMDMPQGVYSGYDIRYDAAGRLTRDVSRGISNVGYTLTGMPWMIGMMSGDCAEYGYSSAGVKLWERIYNGNVTTRRDYLGPCEYVDGRLARVNVPQGYIDSLGVLHAYIRDIQGNVAGVYAARAGKKSLEQLNDYYAYGGLTADSRGQDRNRYKHTGKELVTDLGLNSYDFTARWQYPMAGRFDMPDALAHNKPWNSPYSFCGGDPVNYVDQTGNDYNVKFDDENKTVTISAKYFAYESDVDAAKGAASFWNGQSNKFSFEYNGTTYSVVFDLSVEVVSEDVFLNSLSEHPGISSNDKVNLRNNVLRNVMNAYTLDKKDQGVNAFLTVDSMTPFEERGISGDNTGATIEGKQILVGTELSYARDFETGMHEIGHTLGLGHSRAGIMTPSFRDWTRSKTTYKSDVKIMLKNAIKGVVPVYGGNKAGRGFLINKR